jgi:hypothetical protein
MPIWFRIGLATLLVLIPAALMAQEWIYCPAAPEELQRQCQQTLGTITINQERLAAVGEQMANADIILAKVHRQPGESIVQYKLRVKQQQGVATPETNRWLPVLGRYYDPDRQVMYVALDRQAYWQYVWEALAPDEALARRTFKTREHMSRQFKQTYFTGPDGKLAVWRRAIAEAQRFRRQCCPTLPEETTAAKTVEPP